MIIDFKDSTNAKSITSARSQIKDAGNLKNFDAFLAKNDSFDFSNSDHIASVQRSGDSGVFDIHITFTPKAK